MSLIPGKSPKTFSDNIKEIMDSYKSKGTIGNIAPSNKSKAQKIAVAIAYKKKGEFA